MQEAAQAGLPPGLQEIVEEFQFCEGREKLELLLEYAERMPPLPDWLKANHQAMEEVPECQTPVFIYAEMENGGLIFYFDIPPESPTVRGFAALLAEGLRGATPEAILHIPNDFYYQTGLHEVLSGQRLNGMSAMLAHIKRLALQGARPAPAP